MRETQPAPSLYEQTLAPFAQTSETSLGRRHSEPGHPYRNPYQRDRDRIVHCRAFRRLEGKTQVLVNPLGDHYRNRLTHSIEVAQVSRTIARTLCLHEDLVEAIALAHDLGHPPFGHAGEKKLDHLMEHHGGFEHNGQALRIVEDLESKYSLFTGLNLTFEVRRGLLKPQTRKSMLGAWIQAIDRGLHPSLEAQVVDLADEITYIYHDLEDGIAHHYLPFESLESLSFWADWNQSEDGIRRSVSKEIQLYQMGRTLLNDFVCDLIATTRDNLDRSGIHSREDAAAATGRLVTLSPPCRERLTELRRFLFRNFYHHEEVLRMTREAEDLVEFLFRHFIVRPENLPETTIEKTRNRSLERVVCDYIAGMTDRFALTSASEGGFHAHYLHHRPH